MRLLDAIARCVLAITLAAVIVGHGFIVPLLTAESPLLDANLSRAIASPIELRICDIVVFGCLLTACVVPRWTERHVATTLALLATVLAGLDRLFVLPRLHSAWSQVDLVANRPLDRLAEARLLSQQHVWVVAGIGVCLLTVSILAEYARPMRSAPASAPTPPPVASPAPTPGITPDVGSVPARA